MMEVLFDGTAGKPWGRYLYIEPDQTREIPLRPLRAETMVDHVLSALRAEPLTRDQLAVRLGISRQQAGGALSDLMSRGYLVGEDSPYGAKGFQNGCRTIYRAVIR
jgi:predicted Rossmann fold nucleotide-binding protein DprA/Smf involved in DNA uptake